MLGKTSYIELAKANVTNSRNVVISACSKGGYTIAQQLVAKEGADSNKVTTVFLKGAFHVDDVRGLYNLRDAVNLAIQRCEEGHGTGESWDCEDR